MDPAQPAYGRGESQPIAAATYELPASATSARLARELVRNALDGFAAPVVEVAELLVSELVTNAVAHANSAPVMRIDVFSDAVQVVVQDASPGPVEVRDAPHDAPNGRGLLLVDSLAAAWGWAPTPEGKRVWFTL
jgi:anti-sigma regulatory factor (Ser/Thr protein kinase)